MTELSQSLASVAPPYDAEKASTDQIKQNYRLPPGIESSFERSTLIVGGRGSGKTMLLRHQKHGYSGLALYGDLFKLLAPIAADTGLGGLASDIPQDVSVQIASKTVALLAHWVATQSHDQGVTMRWSSLQKALPASLRAKSPRESSLGAALDSLYESIYNTPLAAFTRGPQPYALYSVFESLRDSADQPVLLLLDRAELVPRPALQAVVQLLDQASPQLLLVASRPGLILSEGARVAPLPGDHYNIRQLGLSPYSSASQSFMRELIRTWLPAISTSMDEQHLSWICTVSRDSVRTALELAFNSLNEDGIVSYEATADQLLLIQTTLMQACQGELADLHPDVPGLVTFVRRKRPNPPWPVKIRVSGANDGLREHADFDRFLDMALRLGLAAMPSDVPWHPYISPVAIEIPPVFLWQRGDPVWSIT